jgi:superfamily II DNA or RNA helicase
MKDYYNLYRLYKYKYILQGGDTPDYIKKDIELLKKLENLDKQEQQVQQISSSLLDYQIPHANKLIQILEKNNTALDASDPGTGKTYVSVYIASKLNLKPIVICPKNVISNWKKVLNKFNVDYYLVSNYELISRGKYINKNNNKEKSPLINVINNNNKISYEWTVNKDAIFIFDEVHRAKYPKTFNAKILIAAKATSNKILMLSATIVEKPLDFSIFAYMLNFSSSLKVITEWIKKLSVPSKTIHNILYNQEDQKASRLSIIELGDKFPDTQITAETYTMKKSEKIKEEYDKIIKKIEEFKKNSKNNNFIISKLQNEFRNIELLKIPTFIELTKDYLENNYSVVIFVNYTESIKILSSELKTKSIIYGDQNMKERDQIISDFQNDKTRIIIANIRAGGVGISLHDINGKYPRVSLISPTQSSTNLLQALGRIHRSGAKSKSLQRIIFAANTPEESISKLLYQKLSNLSLLNEGDIESYYINGLEKDHDFIIKMDNDKKDLNIIIDKQLDRIKNKNYIKTDNIRNLFPKYIKRISGADTCYLLSGLKIFNNISVLLLGEYHDRYNPCKSCKSNCIELIDIISYCAFCIHPNMLDFYIESGYNPYEKGTYKFSNPFIGSKSRSNIFYDTYRHLINKRFPLTENIRMHSVDIRATIKEDDNLSICFSKLIGFLSYIIGYEYNIIEKNMLKPDGSNQVDYNNNKKFLDSFVDNILDMYEYFSDNDNLNLLNKIFSFDVDLLYLFKIKKQIKQLKLSYSNNYTDIKIFIKYVKEIIKKKYIIKDPQVYVNVIKKIIDMINKYKNYKINVFIDKFMNKLNKIIGQNMYDEMSDIIATYVDIYCIFRMLRIFDKKKQTNLIFYGGKFHSDDIADILINSGFFTKVVDYENIGIESDCIDISSV